jgi:hypothetical protein
MSSYIVKCPLCLKSNNKENSICIYLSSYNDNLTCPICMTSNAEKDIKIYALTCGHVMCINCINRVASISNVKENIDNNRVIYDRLLKISKELTRQLRYGNYNFIYMYDNIVCAPINELYDVLNKNIVTPHIQISDIYTVSNYFTYRTGRKRFGINTLNSIDYIDTDRRE